MNLNNAPTRELLELRSATDDVLHRRGVPNSTEYARGWNDAMKELQDTIYQILEARYPK